MFEEMLLEMFWEMFWEMLLEMLWEMFVEMFELFEQILEKTPTLFESKLLIFCCCSFKKQLSPLVDKQQCVGNGEEERCGDDDCGTGEGVEVSKSISLNYGFCSFEI